MLYLALCILGIGCALAVFRWRWGVAIAILVGLIQDPLRKLIPGQPGFMAMASVPVWLAVMAGAVVAGPLRAGPFLNRFPRMSRHIMWFAAYLAIPAVLSATYSESSWQITALGVLIYASGFLALLAGWYFAGTDELRIRLLSYYAIVASLILVGGPLEYYGWSERWAAIGTEALGHIWVTYRTGAAVHMLAGFFRGPDVMGWHAALVFMISAVMALRSHGKMRVFWMVLAVWGVMNIWLCGRRKMLAMVPVFLGCYLFLMFVFRDVRRALPAVGVLVMTLGLGWYLISSLFLKSEVEAFYLTTLYEADTQIKRHAFDSVIETVKQAGFLGYGLGMSQQGVHHIEADKPRMWQESGPTKLVAELGIPGSVLFLLMLGSFALTAYHVMRYTADDASFHVSAGLGAILLANMTAAIVSAQIYGDPFVLILLAFMTGMLFSAVRFVRAEGAPA